MEMEGIEKYDLLSAEQQEQKEKFEELSGLMKRIGDSYKNSIEGDVGRSLIDDLEVYFEEKGLKLKNYLLGRILYDSKQDYDVNIPLDENKIIENFIIDLYERQQDGKNL
jgi:hypothetical protein